MEKGKGVPDDTEEEWNSIHRQPYEMIFPQKEIIITKTRVRAEERRRRKFWNETQRKGRIRTTRERIRRKKLEATTTNWLKGTESHLKQRLDQNKTGGQDNWKKNEDRAHGNRGNRGRGNGLHGE